MRTVFVLILILLVSCSAANERRDPEPERTPASNRAPSGDPVVTPPANDLPHRTVAVGDVRVTVTLAANDVMRGIGLSQRDAVEPGTGMLFIYPEAGLRSFWMKGCRIGLDIAYLDDDRRVMQMGSLDPPAPGTTDVDMPRFRSSQPARFVLETGKGWMAAQGIAVGDRVRFSEDIEAVIRGMETP